MEACYRLVNKSNVKFSHLDVSLKRWKPHVKRIRNFLVHREHIKAVYGRPEDGLLFQVYEKAKIDSPEIIQHALLYDKGNNVVVFKLYSALIISEVLWLLDEFSTWLDNKYGIDLACQPDSRRLGNFKELVESINLLEEKARLFIIRRRRRG